jgi:hypothetical protein
LSGDPGATHPEHDDVADPLRIGQRVRGHGRRRFVRGGELLGQPRDGREEIQ